MVDLGNAVGRKTVAVITDMRQPLGATIGNRLEIAESLTVLQGGGRPELRKFIADLAQIMNVTGIPAEIVNVVIASIIFFVGIKFVIEKILPQLPKKVAKKEGEN